jgi:hypothetical protein
MSALTFFIKSLKLPPSQYCVVGGAMMEQYGLRPLGSHDVDLLVTPELWAELCDHPNWEPPHENLNGSLGGNPKYKLNFMGLPIEAINMAAKAFKPLHMQRYLDNATLFDDVPFIRVEDMLEWKIVKCHRDERDARDINLMAKYLENQKCA